jgi:hypothetical protein
MLPEVLQLGPLMIRQEWIALGVSGIVWFTIMQQLWKRSDFKDIPILEPIVNAVLIVVVVWKLSPFFFSPAIYLERPLLLLYVPGSTAGWLIGLTIAAGYLIWRWVKLRAPWRSIGDWAALGFIAATLIYNLVVWSLGSLTTLPWGISIEDPAYKYHPIFIYRILVALIMLYWIWRNKSNLGTGKWLQSTLTLYAMGLMIVTLFENKFNFFLGISVSQVVYLLMMLCGVGLLTVSNKLQTDR